MPLSDEARARLDGDADQIISRYPRSRSALLPLLHLVQAEEGYVSEDGIAFCAGRLGLSQAEVTAVVTFYSMYKRRPVGEYHVGVCTNTLCAILGGDQILAELREHLGVADDEPTPDGKVSLEHVECNAACDFAPSRGAPRLCPFREASRILAGFPDGQAGQGSQAGAATLAGLRVARQHGWAAPIPATSKETSND